MIINHQIRQTFNILAKQVIGFSTKKFKMATFIVISDWLVKSGSKKMRQLHRLLSHKILSLAKKLTTQGPNEMFLDLI